MGTAWRTIKRCGSFSSFFGCFHSPPLNLGPSKALYATAACGRRHDRAMTITHFSIICDVRESPVRDSLFIDLSFLTLHQLCFVFDVCLTLEGSLQIDDQS